RRGTPPRESGFSDFFAELSAFPPPDRIVGKATPRKKRGPIVDHRPTEKETDMERVQNPVRRRDLRHSHEEEAERAVNAYSDLILRLSYTYLKSTHEAQDICQEVLLKLLCGAGPFESAEHEKAWVVRTTANACKDVLRSARRRRTAPLDAAADALEAPSGPEAPESEVLERVMALPQKYR